MTTLAMEWFHRGLGDDRVRIDVCAPLVLCVHGWAADDCVACMHPRFVADKQTLDLWASSSVSRIEDFKPIRGLDFDALWRKVERGNRHWREPPVPVKCADRIEHEMMWGGGTTR